MRHPTDLLDALTDAIRGQDWRHSALCAQTDPGDDIWFPGMGSAGIGQARRICAMCDVRDECLTYALEHDEHHGVWGGTSAAERQRIRIRRATEAAA